MDCFCSLPCSPANGVKPSAFGGILATIVVGFFCAILTAVGQHHPPKLVEDDMVVEDSLEVMEDSLMEVAPDSISP